MAETGMPSPSGIGSTISRDMDRIHRESYGYGAKDVQTYMSDGLVVSVMDGVEFTPGERVLIEAGRQDLVLQVRSQFQDSIAATFKAAVERATGRKVLAFVSHTHFDPDFMVELFRLAPDSVELEEPAEDS
jgi:uncharacterized protein YbcI